jgi:peptidoglycan/xylan/chitin deacetylase (PgdA/CDA1 family)
VAATLLPGRTRQTFKKLLAHRALLIRLLRRRSPRKNASLAPPQHGGRAVPDARSLSRTPVGNAQLHVRWDRVSVLAALVAVLAMVIAHAVVAVREDPKVPGAESSPIPTSDGLAKPQPKCPKPATDVIRTAPAVRDEADAAARTVALTFDDGPGAATPQVLDVLQRAGVRATFFVVGQQVAANREMLQRIVASGHVLGDHTWSHRIPSASAGWKRSRLSGEIERTRRAILDATGVEPCLFRPPGGVVKGAESVARAAGLSLVLWSVDTRDWVPSKDRGKFAIIIRKRAALGLTEEHPVILLHDSGGNQEATVAALPAIINDYRAHGYRFVTFDQPT